jgi:glycosyltransferase involved in cell wall biosynthesis
MAEKISAIVLYKNNLDVIEDCLKSISWVDEIIAVDTDSTDGSTSIAKKYGAKIFSTKGGNFSEWRNLGAQKASGEWLFYIDSDERVTPELKEEIIKTISGNLKEKAFAIPRRNVLLGHEMKHGGWWPDYVLRLIRKDALLGWEGELHEQPKIKGEMGKLINPFIHITHRSLTEMMEKTNVWSEVEAKLLFDAHHPKMVWWRFFSVACREFWYRGIVKMGFLDGPVGVIEDFYQMISRMITYAKLWEMQINAGIIK